MKRSALVIAIMLAIPTIPELLTHSMASAVGAQRQQARPAAEPQLGRVQGTVYKYEHDLRTNMQSRDTVAGAVIVLECNEFRMQVRTNETGSFWFSGLPAGRYRVKCIAPERLLVKSPAERVFELAEGALSSFNFTMFSNGGIRGRITPFIGLRLDLVLARPPFPEYPKALYAFPDETGSYEFERIPPGQYLLGIRLDRTTPATLPFARYYYPGVTDPARAVVIHVSEGAWVKLQDMPLPPKLASRTVEGKVLYPDGSLAPNAEVAFEMSEYPYGSKAVCRTALDGRFSMTLLDGLKYSVRAAGVGPRSGKPLRSDPVGVPSRGDATDLTVVLSHSVEPSNLLQNPDGSLGILHWTMKKSAQFELCPRGPCLAVRDGGTFSQEINLPSDAGSRFALALGMVSSERVGVVTGLPYMSATLWPRLGRPDAKYLEARMQGTTIRPIMEPNEWVPAFGLVEIPPNAGRFYLFLGQTEAQGVPQNSSAARFTDIGVFLFDTAEEAKLFRDYYFSKLR